MKLAQLLEALDKRGINEALLRGDEPLQMRIEGEWKPQGAPISASTLGALVETGAPTEAATQWQSENRCQFERDGFAIKAARRDGKVQVAIKRGAASTSPFAGAPAASAPAARAPLQAPAIQWFYLDEGAEKGPIAPDRMRVLAGMGAVSGDTLVWCDGMADWKPARDSDLRAMLPAGALNAVPAAPPLSPAPNSSVAPPIAAPRGDIAPGRVGGGRIHEIPPSNDKFSLGAFMLPMFWCFANKQSERFWPILWTSFIPCVGGWISLWLNIQLAGEANSLAWASREWDSVEHFEKTQRVWTIVGAVLIALYVGLFLLGFLLRGSSTN